jgi:adenosylhomocysteinase
LNEATLFFQSVLDHEPPRGIDRLVIVTHLVPGSDSFLLGTHQKLPIAAIIPKPSSVHSRTSDLIRQHIPVLDYTRDRIKDNPVEFFAELRACVGDASFAIIDTGGYFSPLLDKLGRQFGSQLVGIVEDTENGHQKYEGLLQALRQQGREELPYPVISVARSELKNPEDFLVGQAIVFSAEALLRELGNILTAKRALVFGYGKIGSSIASHLRAKGVRVYVYDTDPARQVLALAHGHHSGRKDHLLGKSDLLFCATGNQSLKRQDMKDIRRDAFLFMATSSDDEIEDHLFLMAHASPDVRHSRVSEVEVHGNRFFLCNDGNAANFMHGGVLGPFINLVQGELLFGLTRLAQAPKDRIVELTHDTKRFISDLWLRLFAH